MASKMPAAIDSGNNKVTISMAENLDYKKPLECEFCDVLVSFVNGFSREVGDKVVSVTPYFRLKTNRSHGPECKYNLQGQMKVIVRESEGNILTQLESGKFELRLLAVKKAIQELQELVKEKKKGRSDTEAESKNKEYIKSGKRLGSYINSALRVLEVRSLCENNADIEHLLELVFDGARLPWRDFYFEDTDYFRCYSNLRKATVTVPVVIKGVVKSTSTFKGKGGSFSIINLIGPYRKSDKVDALDAMNISIWSPDLDIFKNYKENDEILAFGIWDAKNVHENENKSQKTAVKTFRNYPLRLWPISKSQLCKVDS
jgi:hypothetical protein